MRRENYRAGINARFTNILAMPSKNFCGFPYRRCVRSARKCAREN
jgi:hypothetical protein